jgi:hypothetical protein
VFPRNVALERTLGGLPGGELDVRRGEQLARAHDRVEVDVLIGDLLDVAAPDRPARVRVRRPDR